MKKPVLFVPDQLGYARPWAPLFDVTMENPEKADVILFTGGSDIDPAFYGEKPGRFTYTNPSRDRREKLLFDEAFGRGQKFLGICRGAQLLCAMAGGKLAQHVEGHGGGFSPCHRMRTVEGDEYVINSVHHQMMLPNTVPGGAELLAWASETLSVVDDEAIYLNGDNKPISGVESEAEVVYFPTLQGLGIQCHPEAISMRAPVMEYFHNLVRERLL